MTSLLNELHFMSKFYSIKKLENNRYTMYWMYEEDEYKRNFFVLKPFCKYFIVNGILQ